MTQRLHVFALGAVIIGGIAVDANNEDFHIQKANLTDNGTQHFIAWRLAPKKDVKNGVRCHVGSERPNLDLAWYGSGEVRKQFANFKSCSDLAHNDTGEWQDYTERIRSA